VNAIKAMSAAMASSCDVSGAAHLPAHIAFRFGGLESTQATTALRLEGVAPSVKHRKEALVALLKSYGSVTSVGAERSKLLWSSIRDVRPFAANGPSGQRPVWRVSTVPSKGAELATLIPPSAQMFYDWAGGLIWIAPLPGLDVASDEIRAAVRATGGHATLIRADASVRAASDVFEPQDGALAAVTKRVKESFDPKGVLNPGRMWAGV